MKPAHNVLYNVGRVLAPAKALMLSAAHSIMEESRHGVVFRVK